MSKEMFDNSDRRNLGEFVAREMLGRRIEQTAKTYDRAMTGLFFGNAGASALMFGVLGAARNQPPGHHSRAVLVPLICFVSGLVAMVVGSFASLLEDSRFLDRIKRSDSIVEVHIQSFPLFTRSGGALWNMSLTRMAILSSVLFVFGCVSALYMIWLSY